MASPQSSGAKPNKETQRAAEQPEETPSSRSPYVRDGDPKGFVFRRKRTAQPTGYDALEHNNDIPTEHFCLKHNYVYYPASWTDPDTGKSFRKGYYDENGGYYADIAFKRNGRYCGVRCVCESCGAQSTEELDGETPLACGQCGAKLRLESALDEYTQDPTYTKENASPENRRRKGRIRRFLAFVLCMALGMGYLIYHARFSAERSAQTAPLEAETPAEPDVLSDVELFGSVIYLDAADAGIFVISEDGEESFDKKLVWYDDDESYYDAQGECWIWYNTTVTPNQWQYWFPDVSSDYDESGWLKYEQGLWYVERSAGTWIPLPQTYDQAQLWRLDQPAE